MCSRMIQYGKETRTMSIIVVEIGNGRESMVYGGLVRDDYLQAKSMPEAKLPDITEFEHHGYSHRFDPPVTLGGRLGSIKGRKAFWLETRTAIFKGIISRWPMGIGTPSEAPKGRQR